MRWIAWAWLVACGRPAPVCQTLLEDDQPTGWERCYPADGVGIPTLDRVGPADCHTLDDLALCDDAGGCGGGCVSPERCRRGGYGCVCAATCSADADCPTGTTCACAVSGPGTLGATSSDRCLPSDCTSSADCGGHACSLAHGPCGVVGLFCRSDLDTCTFGVDCDEGQICRHDGGRWRCMEKINCGE